MHLVLLSCIASPVSAKVAKLEQTLLANRMVMGMTIEEQMMMLEDQIGLKIRIDELEDEVRMRPAGLVCLRLGVLDTTV